jgi:hypothetical protein
MTQLRRSTAGRLECGAEPIGEDVGSDAGQPFEQLGEPPGPGLRSRTTSSAQRSPTASERAANPQYWW